jgi:hypothetical protein
MMVSRDVRVRVFVSFCFHCCCFVCFLFFLIYAICKVYVWVTVGKREVEIKAAITVNARPSGPNFLCVVYLVGFFFCKSMSSHPALDVHEEGLMLSSVQ